MASYKWSQWYTCNTKKNVETLYPVFVTYQVCVFGDFRFFQFQTIFRLFIHCWCMLFGLVLPRMFDPKFWQRRTAKVPLKPRGDSSVNLIEHMGVGNNTGQQSTVKSTWMMFSGPYSSKLYKITVPFHQRRVMWSAWQCRGWCTILEIAEFIFFQKNLFRYSLQRTQKSYSCSWTSTFGTRIEYQTLGFCNLHRRLLFLAGHHLQRLWGDKNQFRRDKAWDLCMHGLCDSTCQKKEMTWNEIECDLSLFSTSLVPPDNVGWVVCLIRPFQLSFCIHVLQDVTGTLVPEWKDLTELQYVDLSGTSLQGDIAVFRSMSKLEVLKLAITRVKGDVESLSEPHLQRCALKMIDLSNTAVGGNIRVFQAFTDLTVLYLHNTLVFGDIRAFEATQKLKELRLEATGVSGNIKSFQRTTQLQFLALSQTHVVGDIEVFTSTPSLKRLYFDARKLRETSKSLNAILSYRICWHLRPISEETSTSSIPPKTWYFLPSQTPMYQVESKSLPISRIWREWGCETLTFMATCPLSTRS